MSKVIIVKECSAGNESVGNEWVETKSFDESATLKEVLDWSMPIQFGWKRTNYRGRVMITVESDE